MSLAIQHLNVVVDPQAPALLTMQETSRSDPKGYGDPNNPDGIDDPSSNNTPGKPRNPGRRVRRHGSGIQPNRGVASYREQEGVVLDAQDGDGTTTGSFLADDGGIISFETPWTEQPQGEIVALIGHHAKAVPCPNQGSTGICYIISEAGS